MTAIYHERHRFPVDVICHTIWIYFGFTLIFRDVEELLTLREIEVSRLARLTSRPALRQRPAVAHEAWLAATAAA